MKKQFLGLKYVALTILMIGVYTLTPHALIRLSTLLLGIELRYSHAFLDLIDQKIVIKNAQFFDYAQELSFEKIHFKWPLLTRSIAVEGWQGHFKGMASDIIRFEKIQGIYDGKIFKGSLSNSVWVEHEATFDAQFLITTTKQSFDGIYELTLPEQKIFGINFDKNKFILTSTDTAINARKQHLYLKHGGQIQFDLTQDSEKSFFELSTTFAECTSENLESFPEYIRTAFSGRFYLKGDPKDKQSWFGDGMVELKAGRLLNIDPIRLSNTINLLAQLKELPSKIFSQAEAESYFDFEPTKFELLYENENMQFNGSIRHRNLRHRLKLKGNYSFTNEDWDLGVKYYYPTNPLGISFKLKGHGEDYNILLDPVDLIRALPAVIIPNMNQGESHG